jgi:hypothetical protein
MGFDKEAQRTCERKGQTLFACFESRKFCLICGSHRTSEVINDSSNMGVEKKERKIQNPVTNTRCFQKYFDLTQVCSLWCISLDTRYHTFNVGCQVNFASRSLA